MINVKFFSFVLVFLLSNLIILVSYADNYPSSGVKTNETVHIYVDSYWTEERMKKAKSLYPKPSQKKYQSFIERRKLSELSKKSIKTSSDQMGGTLPNAESSIENTVKKNINNTKSTNQPFPYTSFPINRNIREYPNQAIGRLFFKKGGLDFTCSAAVINSPNGNIISTAGHCVHPGDGSDDWHTDVTFVPGYRYGSSPNGKWLSRTQTAMTYWTDYGNFGSDYAFIILQPNAYGKNIQDIVGSLGWKYNASPEEQHWAITGYPAENVYGLTDEGPVPMNGNEPIVCFASVGEVESHEYGKKAVGAGCNMGGGASGGPWIEKYRWPAGDTNYITGVNSYIYTGNEVIYTPYFDSIWKELYDHAVELDY